VRELIDEGLLCERENRSGVASARRRHIALILSPMLLMSPRSASPYSITACGSLICWANACAPEFRKFFQCQERRSPAMVAAKLRELPRK